MTETNQMLFVPVRNGARLLRSVAATALGCSLLAASLGCDDTSSGRACVPDTTLDASNAEVIEIGENQHRVESFILIEASAEDVWDVLTDFDTTPDWSTSFQGLTGDVRDGGDVVATYLVPNPATGEVGPAEFPHTLSYEEGVSFGWSDPIAGAAGITDNHVFLVEALSPCQTRFVQTDEFQGTDPAFTTEALAGLSAQGYAAFNAELKDEVERRRAQ